MCRIYFNVFCRQRGLTHNLALEMQHLSHLYLTHFRQFSTITVNSNSVEGIAEIKNALV